jgi:FtsP/CotA-like multicopper oxidase with cupredoxin domain
MEQPDSTRRSFLGLAGGAALLCTIGGEQVKVTGPRDVARADALAAGLERPPAAQRRLSAFPQIQPQPGGRRVEYWVQAESVRWTVIPTRRDGWHGRRIPGSSTYRALVYREMTEGFAAPKGEPSIPGPTLTAEVGDVLVVHFRNADTKLRQPLTMHPHGVKYNPEYDGAYLGRHTRAGGFVAPGEEFTYQWECTPDSEGAWPYHDHGPNHTLNLFRGLFGAVVVRAKGAKRPDVSYQLFLHSLPPNVTGLGANFQCINGRSYAGNTPTLRAHTGQDVEMHVFGMDSMFHTFHVHGHRWRDASGVPVDNPGFGPNETVTARFTEDNPGRWLYHCHVFTHQDMGMAGWYLVA